MQDKNQTTKSILEKEKENTALKFNLMQQTINELKQEVAVKSREHHSMLEDNRKLYHDNENLKRLLALKGDLDYDAD